MYKDIINKIKPNLDRVLERFKEELVSLRTGRASPALIETVEVECYNSRTPLKQLAAITVSDARTLMVQAWDANVIKDIEKAITRSRTGLSVAVSGETIRVIIPSLSEDNRKELVRALHQKMEESKISVRSLREQVWKEIQEGERQGLIREDDKFRGKDELQKVIDYYNNKIDEMGEMKEKEIMTI